MLNSDHNPAAASKSRQEHNGRDQQRFSSGSQTQEVFNQDLHKITDGINSLVYDIYHEEHDLGPGHFPDRNQEIPYRSHANRQPGKGRIVSYSHSPGILRRGHFPGSPQNGMVSRSMDMNHSMLPPERFNLMLRRTQSDINSKYALSPTSDQHVQRMSDISISSTSSHSGNSSTDESALSPTSQSLKQTHTVLHKFMIRHEDEIELDEGDPVFVQKICGDLWCEGTNLRSGQSGVFPSKYVASILQSRPRCDSLSTCSTTSSLENNQFYLRFLGSVEVRNYKGNDVLCTAMKEIVKQRRMTSPSAPPPFCTLDVSISGITVTQHSKESISEVHNCKKHSKSKLGKLFEKDQKGQSDSKLFFLLKNVTFCGCHPNNTRYFAFITKHPEDARFACHVFMSEFSTETVAYAIGKAFKDFYADFLGHQSSSDDFYVD